MTLDRYLARIGYNGPLAPNRTTLDALIRAHVSTIPFSNLEILRGHDVSLDPVEVDRKLVAERRGGYCFEQNGLFARVLEEIGFAVTPVGGRVTLRAAPGEVTPVTHMALRVDLDAGPVVADVGFGALSPTAALALVPGAAQDTPHEPRRITDLGGIYAHEAKLGETWTELYRFTLEEMHRADQELGNWWTSTHPTSRFRQVLMVARAAEDGARLTLTEEALTRRARDGTEEVTPVESLPQLLAILRRAFGLDYPEDTRLRVPGAPWAG